MKCRISRLVHSCLMSLMIGAIATDGFCEDARIEQVRILARTNHADEATVLLSSMDELDDGLKNFLRAQIYYYTGSWKDALEFIAKIQPNDAAARKDALDLAIRIHYLQGEFEDCLQACEALLKADPLNRNARLFQSQCLTASDRFDEAQEAISAAQILASNDLDLLAAQTQLCLAKDDHEQLAAILKDLKETLPKRIKSDSLESLLAASFFLRQMRQFQNANECVATAENFAPADPFLLLEKATLYRMTYAFPVAFRIASELLQRNESCVWAKMEQARCLWEMRENLPAIAAVLDQVLEKSPALSEARVMAVHGALAVEDLERAKRLSSESTNTKVRPALVRLRKMIALGFAASPADLETETDPLLFIGLGQTDAFRADHAGSMSWNQKALDLQPDNLEAIKGLGLASFRTGKMDEALPLLEQCQALSPYDLYTRNLLAILDSFQAPPPANDPVQLYAEYLASQYAEELATEFELAEMPSVHLRFLKEKDDLAVITQGLPYGCCGDPLSTGYVVLGSTIYIWKPSVLESGTSFRLDEAIYRGMAEIAIVEVSSGKAPLWLREGISRFLAMKRNPVWAPPHLDVAISVLRNGMSLKIEELEKDIRANGPLPKLFAFMVVEELNRTWGRERLLELLVNMSNRTTTKDAIESATKQSIAKVDEAVREGLLRRYEWIRMEETCDDSFESLVQSAGFSPKKRIHLVRKFVAAKRPQEALSALQPLMNEQPLSVETALLAGCIQVELNHFEEAIELLDSGLARSANNEATVEDYLALCQGHLALKQVEKSAEALENAARLNPWCSRLSLLYEEIEKLMPVTGERPDYWKELQFSLLIVLRGDAEVRMDLAQWKLDEQDKDQAYALAREAAALRPDWLPPHQFLMPLAAERNDVDQLHISARIASMKQPEDQRIQSYLSKAEKTLAEQGTTATQPAQ